MQKTAYEMRISDGVQTCALPILGGIATKRGHVLTVIDAHAAITGDRSSEPTRESVVININGHRHALLVDAIDEVISVSEDAIGSPPPGMQGIWGDRKSVG